MRELYESTGQQPPEHEEPKPNRRNRHAWTCWQWIYPDCRDAGFTGAGLLHWPSVASVLRDFYGIELSGDLHRRLRICMFEMLAIDAENREVKDATV